MAAAIHVILYILLSTDLPIIFLAYQLIIVCIKCQKIVQYAHYNYPEPKAIKLRVLSLQDPKIFRL